MKNYLIAGLAIVLFILSGAIQAQEQKTKRTEQFSNKEVNVWKTVIYPTTKNNLSMHRHEHNRVLVALTDGLLKITNNKGKVHYLKLQKDKAYYLTKDIPNELHNDVNVTKHPIKVMVIELNNG